MSLTAREAMTHVIAKQAVEDIASDRLKERRAAEEAKERRFNTNTLGPIKPEVSVRRGSEAQRIADEPLLTGDPEWDAIELAATDPSKPLLNERIPRG